MIYSLASKVPQGAEYYEALETTEPTPPVTPPVVAPVAEPVPAPPKKKSSMEKLSEGLGYTILAILLAGLLYLVYKLMTDPAFRTLFGL